MRVVLIVGLRLDSAGWVTPDLLGYRRMNWDCSRARWERILPDIEIFEGYHDRSEGDLFNVARANNRAAEAAGDWDVCIYTGADFQPETAEQVRRAIKTADRHGQFVIAHDQTVMLSEAETETIRRFGTDPSRRMPGTVYDNPFTGICAVPRRLFDDVGGFDERFAGWGWEDQSFWAACWALRGRFGRIRGRAFHLWHPRERVDNEDSPTHATAEVLGRRYLAARRDPAEMRKILDERVA